MNVKDLIIANRSTRAFDEGVAVPLSVLVDCADSARLSASARNDQPLKYRLVFDKAETEAVLACTKWAGYITDQVIPPDGRHPTAFIVICHDRDIASGIAAYQRDVGIAAQSITLTAVEFGFAACMIGAFDASGVSAALDLPENLLPQLVIALGKGDELVVLTEPKDGDVRYFRDKMNVHFVPKRPLGEVVVLPAGCELPSPPDDATVSP